MRSTMSSSSGSVGPSGTVSPPDGSRPGTMTRSPSGIASLQNNPFYLLGATVRDDRRRIVELTNEKQLELEPEVLQRARAQLTNPRRRLQAELGWLPGVAPATASQVVEDCLNDPGSSLPTQGLPSLAEANLRASVLERLNVHDHHHLTKIILQFAQVVEELSPPDIVRDINEDRSVSGFPQIRDVGVVEEELAERRHEFRSAVLRMLDRIPSEMLVDVLTAVAEFSSRMGQHQAPALVDDLVDTYRVEAQDFLEKETENIDELIELAARSAPSGRNAVRPVLRKLSAVTRNWDRVAQPIQISFKARGQHHPASQEVAMRIRNLAVELHNDHDMLDEARKLADLLKDIFAEVPTIVDLVEEDAEALDRNLRARKQQEAERREWKKKITYSAKIGGLIKRELRISPEGVSWGTAHYPLDAVTRVRWGGVRRSSGTTYTIAFGDDDTEAVVETWRGEVYRSFTTRLNRAVGPRLLIEVLQQLKRGPVRFGEAVVGDGGVTLPRNRFFRKESIHYTWSEVKVWSADGAFWIGAKEDAKARAALSYIDTHNTHVLEQIVRVGFKRGVRRLTELLRGG